MSSGLASGRSGSSQLKFSEYGMMTTMARHKDQQARRAQLGQAAQRAVVERGLDGLRLKDVAAEAGVTSAAVLYYYDDLDDLVVETYRESINRFCELREEASIAHADARDQLRTCIDAGVASGPDDLLVRMLLELVPRSLRDPQVAALDAVFYERQVSVYQAVLGLGRAQGHFTLTDQPRDLAGSFVALEDGYQLEVAGGRRTHDEVVRHIRRYAYAVTGCNLD
jgi:AcrR family transcriptional regulator